MALNDNINDAPYVLGRLFSVWEHIQEESTNANNDTRDNAESIRKKKKINSTIKDRYFNAMCATPARIFPILQKLAGHHLRKLDNKPKLKVDFEKQITHLIGKLGKNSLPKVFLLEEQGLFILGYYHQTQARYTKKEDKENVGSN